MKLNGREFEFGRKTYVMGIVNVTPDSFSDGGQFFSADAAIAHADSLVSFGADMLDVGGESTRPGAPPVSVEEEIRRVIPVIEAVSKKHPSIPISVDTTKAEVAAAAINVGAGIVNDISGLTFDPAMPKVVANTKVAACLMHIQGTPQTMQRSPQYNDVVKDVMAFLSNSMEIALKAGVSRDRLIVDPGIGFGKTVEHNLELLHRLNEFRSLGSPILLGTSRKSFLGHLLGGKAPSERLYGSIASVVYAVSRGAVDIVRVHDVAETKDAVWVADSIRNITAGLRSS